MGAKQGLGESVDPDREPDQRRPLSARQAAGVDREHWQDQE